MLLTRDLWETRRVELEAVTAVPRLTRGDRPRLHAQVQRLQTFFLAHPREWFSLGELCRGIGAVSEAGVSARLREMAGELGWTKEVRMRKFPLREYRLTPPRVAPQLELL